jgi:hypothetical protein
MGAGCGIAMDPQHWKEKNTTHLGSILETVELLHTVGLGQAAQAGENILH